MCVAGEGVESVEAVTRRVRGLLVGLLSVGQGAAICVVLRARFTAPISRNGLCCCCARASDAATCCVTRA